MRRPLLVLAILLGLVLAGALGASAVTNLTTTNITYTKSCDAFGCSVQWNSYVCNQDTVTRSFVQGTYWGYSGSISTCTGRWDSMNSTYLPANTCQWIVTYGPGYVGSKVNLGTCITVKSYVDIYCAVSETNENDNTVTKTLCIN
jgi:hypothetical protein